MRRARHVQWPLLLLLIIVACATSRRPSSTPSAAHHGRHEPTASTATTTQPSAGPPPSFFVLPSPDGLGPVAREIANARTSIKMIMFHLSERSMIDALCRARDRGVAVTLILDEKNLKSRSSQKIVAELEARGITVVPSSPEFSITHAKAMVVDDRRLVVMSANLTTIYEKTRDYGIVAEDRAAVAEFDRVFDADVANAHARTKTTPPLSVQSLLWSPVTSEPRLVGLVDEAKTTLETSTENLGDAAIEAALARAAARHVRVRLLAPLCDLNPNALYNVPFVRKLHDDGVDARLMPGPSSPSRPYIHAKMMIVDGVRGYVGSVNFSENSTHSARELGIVFDDRAALAAIDAAFESDWAQAVPPPDDTTGLCGSHKAATTDDTD